MGADTTSTHLIFFIAATVVATAAAGILSGVVSNVVGKATIRGAAFGDELASSIKVIDDASQVPNNPAIFYVKNTGATNLDYYNATVIVDGTVVTTTKTLLNGDTTFRPGAVTQLSYAATLATGDHRVQVVMNNNAIDEFRFRI